jgi:predicted RNase H-like HicB family nuclease
MTVDVLIEPRPDGQVQATLLGWPDYAAQGATEAEALARLRELLAARLAHARIVPLELDLSPAEHPWLRLAERFKDNPLLDEVAAAIAADRRERDAADPTDS